MAAVTDSPVECLDNALKMMAQHIVPSEAYMKKGIAAAERAFKLLKEHGERSSFAIDRIIHSGSNGKKTTLAQSDFDCVVFVNHEEPIFENILDEIEDILTLHGNCKDLKKSLFSIQFTIDGFEFDILPASNFVLGMDCSKDNVIDLQLKRTLDKIKKDTKKYRYMYSSSLSEAVVRFFKKQDGFVNEMARLTKFWYKTLFFSEYISGAKSMVELIAVYAALREMTVFSERSYLRCFSSVLNLIENFDKLKIVFSEEYKFPEHKVPSYILDEQRPLVLEPANPYNNLAKSWSKEQSLILQKYAAETSNRLRIVEKTNYLQTHKIPVEAIFEPQPKVAPIQKYFKNHNAYLVSAEDHSNVCIPGQKIRNEALMIDPQFKYELNFFKHYMMFLAQAFVANKGDETRATHVHSMMCRFIDINIFGTQPGEWAPSTMKHEDYDITLSLPVKCGSNIILVRISYRQ